MDVIGRGTAQRVIEHALTSHDPELIAVWGRRRVGKTFRMTSIKLRHW